MAKASKIYTRLARSPVSLGTYKSLWLAADHIMQVESNGYSENYQRFQLSDIQAFFIRDSSRRLYWNLFWGMIALFAGLAFVSGVIHQDVGVSALFLGIAIVFLAWNNVLGASCQVYIVTRVQTVRLGSLVRQRKARKVLGRIYPLIEGAQTGLVKTPPAAPSASSGPTLADDSPASTPSAST
jgi:hypothetical protein